VTCHYFDNSFTLNHRTLSVRHLPGSHTGTLISESLIEILKDFGITTKLVGIVADNAKNCLKIGTIVTEKFSAFGISGVLITQFSCLCHVINLIVKKLVSKTMGEALELEGEEAIESLENEFEFEERTHRDIVKLYNDLINKCRNICTAFNHATQLYEALLKKQNELDIPRNRLIQEVPHRWNSTFMMVFRISEQAPVFLF
jgi:hypothetical protein